MRAPVLHALLSHWWRHPLQLVSLLAGLAMATALWSGVQAINAQAKASYARAADLLGQNRYDSLVASDGQRFPQQVFVDLRRAGWRVSPVLEGEWRDADIRLRIIGIDPVTAPPGMAPFAARGSRGFAAFLRGPGLAFAAPETIEDLQGRDGFPELVGSVDVPPGTLIMDIGKAQRLLDAPGLISRLVVLPVQPMGQAPLAVIAPDLRRNPPQEQPDIAQLTRSFHLNLSAFGLLSFAVGLFIVHAAIGLSFEQRRPVFRTLRALGVSVRRLVLLSVLEVQVLALVAGLAGVALGYAVAAALLPDVAATLRGLYGAAVDGSLNADPGWWLGGIVVAIVGALAAAAQSLWRLSRMPPLAPALPRAWLRASTRSIAWQCAAAAVLAVMGIALAIWGKGLVAGFVLLGALLMAAAFTLPGLLAGLLAVAGRTAKRPLPVWFWADTRQQLPGLSLALMALLLALAANIGVSTMVGSFRQTFSGWLDQRLTSELYVSARTEEEALRLRDWLAERADAVLPIWSVDVPFDIGPGKIYGIVDHPTYRRNWPILAMQPGGWEQVASGQAALINEQMMRGGGLAPGDMLALPGGPELPIAGVYSDYGNPRAQAIISVSLLENLYPQVSRLRYGVRIAPDKVEDLVVALVDGFGLSHENIVNQQHIKAVSLRVFERTFAVTAALNVLTLAIAGFAMLTSLLTLASMRISQLAPVWALGVGRGRLAWLEVLRASLLAALTMVFALPVGLLLAWALLAIVNVAAFGWRLPMRLFPGDWLLLGGLALLVSLLASSWPAFQLNRTSPARMLGVFANER